MIDEEDPDCSIEDEGASAADLATAPQGDSDNNTTDTTDTTDAEPTSFNPQTITTTPQLTFVQAGGGWH